MNNLKPKKRFYIKRLKDFILPLTYQNVSQQKTLK